MSVEVEVSKLYIGCVYMHTITASASTVDVSYENLKQDVLSFKEKAEWCY